MTIVVHISPIRWTTHKLASSSLHYKRNLDKMNTCNHYKSHEFIVGTWRRHKLRYKKWYDATEVSWLAFCSYNLIVHKKRCSTLEIHGAVSYNDRAEKQTNKNRYIRNNGGIVSSLFRSLYINCRKHFSTMEVYCRT